MPALVGRFGGLYGSAVLAGQGDRRDRARCVLIVVHATSYPGPQTTHIILDTLAYAA